VISDIWILVIRDATLLRQAARQAKSKKCVECLKNKIKSTLIYAIPHAHSTKLLSHGKQQLLLFQPEFVGNR